MKKLLLIAVLVPLTTCLFAQRGGRGGGAGRVATPAAAVPLPPPAVEREVSGIILDEKDQPVIGATLVLSSKKDTIRLATNTEGIFVFKNVQMATFVISANSIGYKPFVGSFKMNDVQKKLVLKPIKLVQDEKQLADVNINGTPSIVYKTDTVEYKASDYHVRENATLDELLKKMEGFEVGSDGSLTHQGQQITKAKLNGKEFAGGDVAQAIQNLPADIIEKVQVVDDYGDQAARTGIKDGDPQKVLNVTTKADRSVGTTGRIIGQAGNDDRYNAQVFVEHINANEQLGLIGNIRNTVNGVASTGVQGGATNGGGGGAGVGAGARGGGSPGTTQSGSPTINYRDQWSKKVQVVSSVAYTFNNNNSINNQYGQRYTSFGPDNFTNNNTSQRNGHTYNARFEMDIEVDSSNYVQITPNFSYNHSTSASNLSQDDVQDYTTGFVHQFEKGTTSNLSNVNTFGLTGFYVHTFKKVKPNLPKRNISVLLSLTHSDTQTNGGSDKDYKYFGDSTQNTLIRDSAISVLTSRNNKNTTYEATVTYTEPITTISQLEFRGDMKRSTNDSKSIQDSVLANGQLKDLTALDNIYNYTTTQTRLMLNYRYNGEKVNLTLGATAIPYVLNGTKVDENVNQDVSTSRSYFRVIPTFRFAYSWSKTERFTLTYTGANQDPSFQEIQPFTDRSDPKNIIVGNPNLTPVFNNSINAQFNDYIANSKFNFSLGVNATFVDNKITTNTLQIREPLTVDPLNPAKNTFQNINQTNYVNLDGAHSVVTRYNISRQLDDRRYNLALNGNITYSFSPAMSNNQLYHTTDWRFDERFGPRINPNDNIEINPYIGYDVDRTFTTLLGAKPTLYRTTMLAVDGKMYFLKTFQVNYSATKSMVTSSSGLTTNPLVLNAGFQKEFFQRKNLVLTFDVYDLLHQNKFIQQTVTPTGVTNTLSNSLSRYFLVGLRLNLQKWGGRPTRNGRPMNRRGDGSFIYD